MLESFRYGQVEKILDEGGWDSTNHQIIKKYVENAKLDVEVWKEFSHSVLSAHKLPHIKISPPLYSPISFAS